MGTAGDILRGLDGADILRGYDGANKRFYKQEIERCDQHD